MHLETKLFTRAWLGTELMDRRSLLKFQGTRLGADHTCCTLLLSHIGLHVLFAEESNFSTIFHGPWALFT